MDGKYLLALVVDVHLEGRVLLLESVKGTREIGCLLSLRFDRQ